MKASPGYIDGWGQLWTLSLTPCLPHDTWVGTRGWRGQVRTFQHSLHICHVLHVARGRCHVSHVLGSPGARAGAAEVQSEIGFPETLSSISDSTLYIKKTNCFNRDDLEIV